MTVRGALIAGTAASLAVTSAWSYTAMLTISAPADPHLTGNLPGDYAQLAASATGSSPWALFAALAVTCALRFLVAGLRARRRALREAAADLDETEYTEAVPASAGRRY
jgi:hypothetical protein